MKLRNFTILFLFSLLLGVGIGSAQTFTPITATITAESYANSAYYNGSWSSKYYNPSSTLPPVYTKTGVKVQTIYSGVMDGTGTFTQSMPDVMQISPAGGSWIFTICPNGTASCTVMKGVALTGSSTVDLSSTFSGQITIPQVITPIFPVGYGYNYNSMLNYNDPTAPYYVNGSAFVSVPNSAGITPYHLWFYNNSAWHDLSAGSTPTVPTCIVLASDYVCTDPTATQEIVQPSTTLFQVDGGSFFGDKVNTSLFINGNGSQAYGNESNETAIGFGALGQDTSGYDNVASGDQSLANCTTCYQNVANGFNTLETNVSGYGNVAEGSFAGFNETGSNQYYVNNLPQATITNDRSFSLLWGTFAGTAITNQGSQLSINAQYLHFTDINQQPCTSGYALYATFNTSNQGLEDDTEADEGCALTTLTSNDGTVTITQNGDSADLSVSELSPGTATVTTDGTLPLCNVGKTCNSFGGSVQATAGGDTISITITFSKTLAHNYNCVFSQGLPSTNLMTVITQESTDNSYEVDGDTTTGFIYGFNYLCSPN